MVDKNQFQFIFLVTLLSSISLFSTDIFLPALPQMAEFFQCSHAQIQMSFSISLIGIAACHLLTGLLADRFGRKKVLLFGMILFTTASILCALAQTIQQFVLFRLLQAIGGGSGSVISRTLIVDRYDRKEAVKIFSTIFPIASIGGAIAPFIGGYMTYFWTWQVTFIFIAIVGVGILTSVIILENKEALSPSSTPIEPLSSQLAGKKHLEVVTNLEFIAHVCIIAACFSAFRSYIVESPFVFTAQGFDVQEIGRFYMLPSVSYIIGNLLAKRLIQNQMPNQLLRTGMILFVFGAACLLVVTYIFPFSPYALIIAMSMLIFGNGLLFPTASAGAMTAVPKKHAGIASGFLGASGFIASALAISWVGDFCQGDAQKLAFFIAVPVVFGLISYLTLASHSRHCETTAGCHILK